MRADVIRCYSSVFASGSILWLVKCAGFYLLALTVLLFFCLMLPAMIYGDLAPLVKAQYDYRLASVSSAETNMLKSETTLIDGVASVRSLSSTAVSNDAEVSLWIDFVDADNLSYIDITPYASELIEQGSYQSFAEEGTSHVALSSSAARLLSVGPGDEIILQLGESQDAKERFVVEAVFEDTEKGLCSALGFYSSAVDDIWRRHHGGEELPISMAWITEAFPGSAQGLLWEQFRKDEYMSMGYSEVEVEQINRQYNTSRIQALEDAYRSLSKIPWIAVVSCLIGSLGLFVLVLRESNKIGEANAQEISVLKALGAKASDLTFACVGLSVLTFVPSLVLSSILVKAVLYDKYFVGVPMPEPVLQTGVLCCLAIFVFASTFGSFRQQYKAKGAKLCESLSGMVQ